MKLDASLKAALRNDTTASWRNLTEALTENLSDWQCGALGAAALYASGDDIAPLIAEHFINRIGPPIPALINQMTEARSWASFASRSEIKAYAVSCFEALPLEDQVRFLSWAGQPVRRSAA